MASSPALTGGQARTISLPQIVRTLRRHVPLIAVATALGVIGSFLYAHGLPRTYTAYTSIALGGDRIAIPQLQGALRSDNLPDPLPLVRTEVQALSARELVQGVIDKLHLELDPEFNASLRAPSLLDRVKGSIRSLLPQGPAGAAVPGPDEAVLGATTQALAIFHDNRSLVISIAFTAQDPRLAASVANTLVRDYLAGRSGRRTDADQGANKALVGRIAEVKGQLDDIEKQMSDMRSRSDIVALRAGSVGQQQVEELATAAAAAGVERTQLEANWNRATTLARQGASDALAGVLNSPTVSQLRDQESQANAKVAELSTRYGTAYPGVRSASANLTAIRGQLAGEVSRIISSLGSQLGAARDKQAELTQQLTMARRAGVTAENARAQLDQLGKEAETRRALYQSLLQSEQQTLSQPVGAQPADVRVLSAAVPPGSPSGPNTKFMVGMGGLGGLVLGSAFAMLRLRAINGFDGAQDVTWATGLGVLAVLDRGLSRRGMASRVLARPAGPEMQALRGLRDRVRHASRNGAPRTVLFVPTRRRSDAGDLAIAFARAAAIAGEQVLLIEADLDLPSAARLLDVRSDGLQGILLEGTDWRDATVADPASPLDVVVVQHTLPGAAALLSGVAMQNLLVEARAEYQLVVLTAAPAHSAAGAAMTSRADLTLLVLDARAGASAAHEALQCLNTQPGAVLAAVLAR